MKSDAQKKKAQLSVYTKKYKGNKTQIKKKKGQHLPRNNTKKDK